MSKKPRSSTPKNYYVIGFSLDDGGYDVYDAMVYDSLDRAQEGIEDLLENCDPDEKEGWFVYKLVPVRTNKIIPQKVQWLNVESN